MKTQWQQLSEKFSKLTTRETTLIVLSGLVVLFMVPFSLFIEPTLAEHKKTQREVVKLTQANHEADININELTSVLKADPNEALRIEIAQLEKRLALVDQQLLALTEELINPVEMRQALLEILQLQKGVALTSFKVLPVEPLIFTELESAQPAVTDVNNGSATVIKPNETLNQPINTASQSFGLYRHGIEITLTGKYFQLRDYLEKLEALPWKFYWQNFHYQLIQYPKSELKIEIYSLSTEEEFIGV